MNWEDRKYFASKFGDNNDFFLYNFWPFGVRSAPSICQCLFMHVVRFITRVTGWYVTLFLDDFLFRISCDDHISEREAQFRVDFILSILHALGLRINKKSQLIPVKELLWLGAYVNTCDGTHYGTESKFTKFARLTVDLSAKESSPVKALQELLGLFNFLCPPSVRLLSRPLELVINSAMHDFGRVPTSKDECKRFGRQIVQLPPYLTELLQFWASDLIESLGPPPSITLPSRHILCVTDASETLGGFFSFEPIQQLPHETYFDEETFLNDMESLIPSNETFLPLSRETRVLRLHQAFNKPSSFIRELYVVMRAILICIKNQNQTAPQATCVHILTDNQGLARTFPNIKCRSPWELELISRTFNLLPVGWTIRLHWHARDCKLAQLADKLSKIGSLRLTKQGLNHITNLLQTTLHVRMSHVTLALTHDNWAISQFSQSQIFIIHPLLYSGCQTQILKSLIKYKATGVALLPSVPSQLSGHIIGEICTRSPLVVLEYPTQSTVRMTLFFT